jgi:hypothetical protein
MEPKAVVDQHCGPAMQPARGILDSILLVLHLGCAVTVVSEHRIWKLRLKPRQSSTRARVAGAADDSRDCRDAWATRRYALGRGSGRKPRLGIEHAAQAIIEGIRQAFCRSKGARNVAG